MKKLMIALSAMLFVTSCNNVTELPQVTTTNPTVSDTAVIVGGDVTFTGGDNNTTRGVCWSTSPNPTTSDSFKMDASNGSGEFSFDISGLLSPNNTYYIKSFAENKIGKSYGQELSFVSRYGNPNNAIINANGCVECDNYAVGDTFQMNQQIYIVANRSMLLTAFANGDDMSTYCTSKVTSMFRLFSGPFNQDISNWDVSNVTDMWRLFYSTGFSQDIGNWDVSNVTGMSNFFGGRNYNHDLSGWCVTKIPTRPQDFGNLASGNMPIWGTCP